MTETLRWGTRDPLVRSCGCDRNGRRVADDTFRNVVDGYDEAILFAGRLGVDVLAFEGTGPYGRCLTDHIAGRGGRVVEVPTRRTARSRRRDA